MSVSPTVSAPPTATPWPTSTCPTELENKMAMLFFDQECVANMPADTFECPMDTLNLFVEEFIDPLRFESGVLTLIGLILLAMLMQLGGIPTARGNMGVFLWGIYTTGLVLQWLSQLGSVIMVIAAYCRVREVYGPCMEPFNDRWDLLDVIALAVFPFVPIVLTKLVIMNITFAGITEAVKVYYGSQKRKTGSAFTIWGCEQLDIDEAMLSSYVGVFVVLPVILSLAMWAFSLSSIFTIIFFIPIFLACVLSYLVVIAVVQVFAICAMTCQCTNKIVVGIQSMLSFAVPNDDGALMGVPAATTFIWCLMFSLVPLLLAPPINFGTWLAAYIYAGNSTDENMQVLADMYLFMFEVFRTFEFALPAISIDVSDLGGVMTALAYLADFNARYSPEQFLEGARGLLALNCLLSGIKALVAIFANVMSGLSFCEVFPNVDFCDCAAWDDSSKWERNVDKAIGLEKKGEKKKTFKERKMELRKDDPRADPRRCARERQERKKAV